MHTGSIPTAVASSSTTVHRQRQRGQKAMVPTWSKTFLKTSQVEMRMRKQKI